LYSIICKPGDVVCALKKLIRILDEHNLKVRKVPEELVSESQNLRVFLSKLLQIIQERNPRDYADLLKLLDKVDVDKQFLGYLPFKGSLIESLSVLTLKSRRKAVLDYLDRSIERTGRIEDELFEVVKVSYYEELLESVALFYALKAVGSKLRVNPLKEIRANVGNRSIEEYFSDIIAGWIYEDWVVANIKANLPAGCTLRRGGTDADRKIKFSEIGGEPDFEVCCSGKLIRLEVQRVGKNSCNVVKGFDFRGDRIESTPKLMWIQVKTHKISSNDFIIFIFPPAFKEYEPFKGKFLVVPTRELVEIEGENEAKKCWYCINSERAAFLLEEVENELENLPIGSRTKDAFRKRLRKLKESLSKKEEPKYLRELFKFVKEREQIRNAVESKLYSLVKESKVKFFLLKGDSKSKVGVNLKLIGSEDLIVKFDRESISKLLDN